MLPADQLRGPGVTDVRSLVTLTRRVVMKAYQSGFWRE